MKKLLMVIVSLFMFTSCATIVKGKTANFKIKSATNRMITVRDSYGKVVKTGYGEMTVSLNKAKAPFEGATYEVSTGVEKVLIQPSVNIGAFIIGNFFVPTWLGYVVDGVTGSMWDLTVDGNHTQSIQLK